MITLENQIVHFHLKSLESDPVLGFVLKHELDHQSTTSFVFCTILRTNGQIYTFLCKYDECNKGWMKMLPIEEQIDVFNKYFYKFINPPVHLKDHLAKPEKENIVIPTVTAADREKLNEGVDK